MSLTGYESVRKDAQARCNADGFDRGIERDHFGAYHHFMLPQRKNRYGHELRCEVVMCEKLDHCRPGHGPMAARS
jgi:hypothetical protein